MPAPMVVPATKEILLRRLVVPDPEEGGVVAEACVAAGVESGAVEVEEAVSVFKLLEGKGKGGKGERLASSFTVQRLLHN